MNQIDYIKFSLELHLFFDRIMKEHSYFLESSFTEKNKDLKKIAHNFTETFSDILEDVIQFADMNIGSSFLSSQEIVTKNTLDAEQNTSRMIGIPIRTNITLKELNLRPGSIEVNERKISQISNINRQTLPIIQSFIQFKKDILKEVLSCKIYTTNYPLLINHIMNEAQMYYELLSRVENRAFLSADYLYEQELFWNRIMKEHAEFIRGLLDPSEVNLMTTANQYASKYESLLQANNEFLYLTNDSLNLTLQFRDFKSAGEEGILNCQIKSIISPLLADHVVREANHFIRILRTFEKK